MFAMWMVFNHHAASHARTIKLAQHKVLPQLLHGLHNSTHPAILFTTLTCQHLGHRTWTALKVATVELQAAQARRQPIQLRQRCCRHVDVLQAELAQRQAWPGC
jgi:hypothetical protein